MNAREEVTLVGNILLWNGMELNLQELFHCENSVV